MAGCLSLQNIICALLLFHVVPKQEIVPSLLFVICRSNHILRGNHIIIEIRQHCFACLIS